MCDLKRSDIEFIINDLNNAVNVCHDVDNASEDSDRSYPFATGYSRAAMQTAIRSLKLFLK